MTALTTWVCHLPCSIKLDFPVLRLRHDRQNEGPQCITTRFSSRNVAKRLLDNFLPQYPIYHRNQPIELTPCSAPRHTKQPNQPASQPMGKDLDDRSDKQRKKEKKKDTLLIHR